MAAFLAPPILSVLDDQETTMMGNVGAGLLMGSGIVGGGMIGANSARRAAADPELKRSTLDELKVRAQQISNEQGVAAGQAHFAQGKEKFMDDVINPVSKKFGLNESPMFYRRGMAGSALGALTMMLPAYMAMRNGEVQA